jgi:hypothetical protein
MDAGNVKSAVCPDVGSGISKDEVSGLSGTTRFISKMA